MTQRAPAGMVNLRDGSKTLDTDAYPAENRRVSVYGSHEGGMYATPPRRDTRRSRAMGGNLIVTPQSAFPTGMQGSFPATNVPLCSYDTGGDDLQDASRIESETLIAFLKAFDFAENAVTGPALGAAATDPFAGVGAVGILPPGIFQSLIVLAKLEWGHDGVNEAIVMNLPPGAIIKAALAGTYAKSFAQLSAKYLERQQAVNNPAATQQFFYIDPNPVVRNNIWNSMGSPAMQPLEGYLAGTAPTTPVHVEGILSLGAAVQVPGGQSDRSSRPTRRFYGSFPTEAAGYPGGGAWVRCPVAFGAAAVMLVCNPTPFTNQGGNILSTLLMGTIDANGDITAQLLPNMFLPLTGDVREVFVYNTAANGGENPFTLVYDLGL